MLPKKTRERISGMVTLPSRPVALERIAMLLRNPRVSMAEVGDAISLDVPLAAMVLRFANSAYYGSRVPILSLRRAAGVLGIDAINNLLLQASIIRDYEHLAKKYEFDLFNLWKHAVLTAQVTEAVSRIYRMPGSPSALQPDEFYTCGLMHDMGRCSAARMTSSRKTLSARS